MNTAMENQVEKLSVLYSTDDRYAAVAGVSIISLLENSKAFAAIRIYYIDCGLTEERKLTLKEIVAGYGRELVFVSLNEILSQHTINAPNPSYYGRFLAPFFVEEDKLLYLDADLLIVDSVMDLWATNVDGYSIAAVQTCGLSPDNRAKLDIPKDSRYINSGMLLLNLKYWRTYHITEKLLDYLSVHGEIPPYHDQNILNTICYAHTKILHPRYNLIWGMIHCKPNDICKLNKMTFYYTKEEIETALKDPCIIHFSNSIYGRPWNKGCKHPHKDLYLKYRSLSPWKNTPLGESKISGFRKIRNDIYSIVPSKVYCVAQRIERCILKNIVPVLPSSWKAVNWVRNYMNGN